MVAFLPMLAGYALQHVQTQAQNNLALQHQARMDQLKSIMGPQEQASVESGQGSFIASEAGQAALKKLGLSKDDIAAQVIAHKAHADQFSQTARGRLISDSEKATQPGEVGQQGQAGVTAITNALNQLSGPGQQASTAAPALNAAGASTLQGAQIGLAQEQGGLAKATGQRVTAMTGPEVAKIASDITVGNATAGNIGVNTARTAALTQPEVDLKAAEAAHQRALTTFMPETVAQARQNSDANVLNIRNQYELGLAQNVIAKQNANTAEERVKVERENIAATTDYQNKHLENLRILQAAQTQDHMRALYPNASPVALRNVAQYSVGIKDTLPAGSELPSGMSDAMVKERLRLTNQIEKNIADRRATMNEFDKKDFRTRTDAEKYSQMDLALTGYNANLLQTLTENTALTGTPYDVMAGKDKAEFLRDNMVLYDTKKGIYTTVRQAERDYGSIQAGTGNGIFSGNKPIVLGASGLSIPAAATVPTGTTTSTTPANQIVDRITGKSATPATPPTAKSTPAEDAAWQAQQPGARATVEVSTPTQTNRSSVSDRRLSLAFDRHNRVATPEFKLQEKERPIFIELMAGGMPSGAAADLILKRRER